MHEVQASSSRPLIKEGGDTSLLVFQFHIGERLPAKMPGVVARESGVMTLGTKPGVQEFHGIPGFTNAGVGKDHHRIQRWNVHMVYPSGEYQMIRFTGRVLQAS